MVRLMNLTAEQIQIASLIDARVRELADASGSTAFRTMGFDSENCHATNENGIDFCFMDMDDVLSLKKTQWGVWQLEKSNWTLVHTGEGSGYDVDLEDMNTTGQMLDWIFQVSEKSWATRQDIGDLVEALDDIFNPQQYLCSGGANKTMNASEFLKQRYK
jgi:hypothetical protein